MIIVKITHWCPNCRVSQDDWRVGHSESPKVVRRGDPWNKDWPLKAYDKCVACHQELWGNVLTAGDEELTLSGVEELAFRR